MEKKKKKNPSLKFFFLKREKKKRNIRLSTTEQFPFSIPQLNMFFIVLLNTAKVEPLPLQMNSPQLFFSFFNRTFSISHILGLPLPEKSFTSYRGSESLSYVCPLFIPPCRSYLVISVGEKLL